MDAPVALTRVAEQVPALQKRLAAARREWVLIKGVRSIFHNAPPFEHRQQ